jgi:polar amino acid transport system substrate-binding protein
MRTLTVGTLAVMLAVPGGLIGTAASEAASASTPKACGTGGTLNGYKLPTSRQSPTVAKICKAGYLAAGYAPFAPHAFQSSSGAYLGPDVQITGPAVAKALGVRFKIIPVNWDSIVLGLQTGKYEMITTGLTYTAARAKVISYALDSVGGTCFAVLKSSPFKTVSELNSPNVTVDVDSGTSWVTSLPPLLPKAKFNSVVPAEGQQYDLSDVLAKRASATPIDNVVAKAVEDAFPSLRVVPAVQQCLTHPSQINQIGIGVPKGDGAFQKLVQEMIKQNKSSIDKMLSQYESQKYINLKG